MSRFVAPLCLLFVLAVCVLVTRASPAVGVTPTLIGRGTYDAFRVQSAKDASLDFDA